MPSEYYCQNCGSEIKPSDTVCLKCGKNLSDVGRRIVVTLTDSIGFSDSVETKLTKEQVSIIKKVLRTIKRELAKKELESITINFGVVSFTFKNKEKT